MSALVAGPSKKTWRHTFPGRAISPKPSQAQKVNGQMKPHSWKYCGKRFYFILKYAFCCSIPLLDNCYLTLTMLRTFRLIFSFHFAKVGVKAKLNHNSPSSTQLLGFHGWLQPCHMAIAHWVRRGELGKLTLAGFDVCLWWPDTPFTLSCASSNTTSASQVTVHLVSRLNYMWVNYDKESECIERIHHLSCQSIVDNEEGVDIKWLALSFKFNFQGLLRHCYNFHMWNKGN